MNVQPVEERFWSKVEFTDGCWLWTAGLNSNRYAQFNTKLCRKTKTYTGHRLAFRELRGEIPEGLELDHLCRVRHCVNPWHLEPVSRQENILRGLTVPALRVARTHCPQGHEYNAQNTRVSGRNQRSCKQCHRDRGNKRYWSDEVYRSRRIQAERERRAVKAR